MDALVVHDRQGVLPAHRVDLAEVAVRIDIFGTHPQGVLEVRDGRINLVLAREHRAQPHQRDGRGEQGSHEHRRADHVGQ